MSLSVVTLALYTTLEVRQLLFSGQCFFFFFFPAVTVAFRGGCLACIEDFSVVPNYSFITALPHGIKHS